MSRSRIPIPRFGLRTVGIVTVAVALCLGVVTTPLFKGAAPTGRELDVAFLGRGYLSIQQVHSPDTYYTRLGRLYVDADNQLCVGDPADRWRLEPNIPIPMQYTAISISKTGHVTYRESNFPNELSVGQILLTTFANEEELEEVYPGVFKATATAGLPNQTTPGNGGAGFLRQRWLQANLAWRIDWHMLALVALFALVGYLCIEVRRLRIAMKA